MYSFPREDVPIDDYTLPLGKAEIMREGKDVTLIAWGAHVVDLQEACTMAYQKDGISVELIDLQTIVPWDEETIMKSVKKTRRVVISHEATKTGGFGAELATSIQEKCFVYLEAPVQRVTGYDTPFPLAFEKFFMPNKFKVYDCIKNIVKY